jgi:hypothetical protein
MAVFRVAFECWIDERNRRDFSELIRESRDELKALTAGEPPLVPTARGA